MYFALISCKVLEVVVSWPFKTELEMKMFGLNTPMFFLNVQLTIEIVRLFKSLTSILVVILSNS